MAVEKLERGTTAVLHNTASTAAVANSARSVASAEYDNQTDLYPFGDMELTCTWTVNPTADSLVSVYVVPCLDGTNYADGSDSIVPAANLIAGSFSVRAATTAQRLYSRGLNRDGFTLPPAKFKVILLNQTGQSMPAGWGLKLLPFRYQSV